MNDCLRLTVDRGVGTPTDDDELTEGRVFATDSTAASCCQRASLRDEGSSSDAETGEVTKNDKIQLSIFTQGKSEEGDQEKQECLVLRHHFDLYIIN